MISSEFWGMVEAVETLYRPEEPVLIMGKKVTDRAETLRAQMFQSCTMADEFINLFFNRVPNRVLDLGCGMGANSIPLAKKGSYVCGIDNVGDLLDQYLDNAGKEGCNLKNIRLRCCDITQLDTYKEYEETFDLVVAVDVLPYVSPKDLRSTMGKIRECMSERGQLFGSIFTVEGKHPAEIELTSKLGGHYYEGGKAFVVAFLTECGFEIERLRERTEGGFSFVATKL